MAIRHTVFVVEQHVPVEEERDQYDDSALHFLVSRNEQAIATGRLLHSGQIGRMAVLAEFRGSGIGGKLLKYIIDTALEQGQQTVFLHAQIHAINFYQRYGFVIDGEEFMDAGIAHKEMKLAARVSS